MLSLGEVRVIVDRRLGVVTLGSHFEEISNLLYGLHLVVYCKEIHIFVRAVNEFGELFLSLVEVLDRELFNLNINVARVHTLLKLLR